MTQVLRAITLLAITALTASCESKRPAPPQPLSPPQPSLSPKALPSPQLTRINAAIDFTRTYAHSRLALWNLRAAAAGTDCGVLYVRTAIVMDDSMVEALHYGAASYRVNNRGVYEFCSENSFRGVAYQDPSRKVWRYGDVSDQELLSPCQ